MNEYMKIALDEATYGVRKQHGGPFGCVIVKDGKVIAKTHNEVVRRKDATNHAEIRAIQMASKKLRAFDLSGCELYATGKPCPMCRHAIMWAKISKVYYGCDYEDAHEIGFMEETGNVDGYMEIQIEKYACKKLYNEYGKGDHTKY